MTREDTFFQIAPRITAFLSICGSSFIVSDVLRSKKKRSLSYHRIMLGMSICDLVASISYFLGRWPLPTNDPSFSGGRGTTQTCTAQGFFGQFVLSTVGYNTSLAVYYFLVINKGWKEDRVRRAELLLHIFANSLWFITGFTGIILEIFNAALFNCWVAPSPYDCNESGEPCVRGAIANYFQWAFYYGPVFVMIMVVTILMFNVYAGVLIREKKVEKYIYRENSEEKAKRKRSKQVAIQGMWYLAPFYLTWVFPITYQLTAAIGNIHVPALSALTGFFIPFQGVLNFIVYIRPRYLRYRRNTDNADNAEGPFMDRSARNPFFATLSSAFLTSSRVSRGKESLEDSKGKLSLGEEFKEDVGEAGAAETLDDETGLSPDDYSIENGGSHEPVHLSAVSECKFPDDCSVENGGSHEPVHLSAVSECKESYGEECKEEFGEAAPVAAEAVDGKIG